MSEGSFFGQSVALNTLFVGKAGENFPLGYLTIDLSTGTLHFPIEPSQPDMIEDGL